MGYSNGQLETSSGTGQGERGEPGLPGIGFNLTDDGNFDLDSKRLTDVADPVHDGDAATKKYVDDHIHSGAVSKKYVDDENARQDIAINSKAGKDEVALLRAKDNIYMNNFRIFNLPLPSGPNQPATKTYVDQKNTQQDIAINSKAEGDEVLLLDGSKSMTGNLQMGKKKITDLGDGSDDGDAVNYSQLISHTTDHKKDYQLASSPNFYREFGDKGALTKSRVQISGHLHLDLYDVGGIEGRDSGFGGEAWSSLRMTNTLERGIYTVVFETFSRYNSLLNDETLLYSVHGDAHFQIITFSHDWESGSGGNTPHSKAYIQFSSDGQPGEIKFQIRYYGRSYNNLSLDLLFYGRVLRGKHTNTFDHQLFDVKETESVNAFLFFEDIKMNDNRIYGLPQPTGPQQPATKKYVDDNALLLSGGNMTGSFSMQGNRSYSLPIPTGLQQPATKEYTEKYFLRRTGNETTDYNADSKKLVNLADPTNDNDAANKRYVLGQVGNVDLTAYLKRDGTGSMTGNLQMGDHTITGIRSSSGDDAALTNGGAKSLYLPLSGNKGMEGILNMSNNAIRYLKMPPNDPSSGNPPDDCALNFKYFHSQRGDLERQINAVGSKAFSKDGSDPMEGKLDMNLYDIINLPTADSNESSYAANVNYVNKTVSDNNATISGLIDSKITEAEKFNIKSSTQENAFLFVMENDLFREDDDDITKVGEVDRDFYQIKKATYEFTIKYDTSIKYYSSRLSIDLISLPLGEYTLVYEMYYSDKIDQNEVIVTAGSSTLNVSKVNTNSFSDHSRSIINFHKYIFSTSYEDLDIDIILKHKFGERYDPNTTIYVIVYGVKGHQNDVSTLVWDGAFVFENKALKLETNIDMNDYDIINVDKLSLKSTLDMGGNEIKNLGDGIENGDAANIKQLNEYEDNLVNYISRKITEVDKNLGTQKVELIKDLNDAICDYSFSNWKVCEFYVTDGNDYDGSLRDRKPNGPFYKLEQSDTNHQPVVVANGHAGNAYFSFNPDEWFNVNYSLKDREYISVFIVYASFKTGVGTKRIGLWGDHNRDDDSRSIHINEKTPSRSSTVTIKSGNEVTTISSFPSKANPTLLDKILLISVHFNTKGENNSEFYCNGKQLDRFITDSTKGQNNFTVGEIGVNTFPNYRKEKKRIYYFSLFHNYFFNPKNIKRMHRHLCERYSIDHDPIDIS